MLTALFLAIACCGLAWLAYRSFGRSYLQYRGKRIITCPETLKPAAVELDAGHAALTEASDRAEFRLASCSRWPERQGCGQECLRQIELAPTGCLVRTILDQWYEDKSCALCGKRLAPVDWLEHKPAVMGEDRSTREWRQIPAETIPDVLATHQPICWNCHIAETFRRERPDLVVDR